MGHHSGSLPKRQRSIRVTDSSFRPPPLGSSLPSLRLSYLSADYSALRIFLQQFPNLDYLLIHTPDLREDNSPLHISRPVPAFHGILTLLSFDMASSPFISHLACLSLRFSSISAFDCDFSYGTPLTSLLAVSSSLRNPELEYVTCSRRSSVSIPLVILINSPCSQLH